MKKVFTDSISSSREPAKFIGSVNGYDCYESDSIYMTHLVRMEKPYSNMMLVEYGDLQIVIDIFDINHILQQYEFYMEKNQKPINF